MSKKIPKINNSPGPNKDFLNGKKFQKSIIVTGRLFSNLEYFMSRTDRLGFTKKLGIAEKLKLFTIYYRVWFLVLVDFKVVVA